MNSEKTRLRKSFGARRSIRHKVPKNLKFFENSKFSRFYIRISMIPFITRYKGNHWNPYIKSRKFRIFEKFEIFGHLVTNWSPSSETFSKSSFLWVHSLIICYNKKIVSRVRATFFSSFSEQNYFSWDIFPEPLSHLPGEREVAGVASLRKPPDLEPQLSHHNMTFYLLSS